MHHIGQLDRVRGWRTGNDTITAPYLIDWRKSAGMHPILRPDTTDEEWWTDRWGVSHTYSHILPGIGGANQMVHPYSHLTPWAMTVHTQQSLALNAAYTYNVGGPACAWRVHCMNSFTLTNVYYYIPVAATGTQANVNDINFELRSDNGSFTGPGATLLTSGVANPNSDSSGGFPGWHKIVPTQFAMTAGARVWAIITDADGNATDNCTVQSNLTNWAMNNPNFSWSMMPFTTTNGFTTAATFAGTNPGPTLVLEDNTGQVWGSSITSFTSTANTNNRRGVYLVLLNALKFTGLINVNTVSQFSGGEIYDGTTAPGGATLRVTTDLVLTSVGGCTGWVVKTPFTTTANVPNRFVFTYNAVTTNPFRGTVSTNNGYDIPLFAAKPGATNMYYTEANGTTDWSNDLTNSICDVVWLFQDQLSPTPGGGLLIPGGMRGGFHGGV